jgi:hypothetical protein
LRLLDAYVDVSGDNAYPLPENPRLPINIPASRYLRAYSKRFRIFEPLRLRRIVSAMTRAAQTGRIFHLWWHPEDFSGNVEDNLRFLEQVLKEYKQLREVHGMQSLNMAEITHLALSPSSASA